MRCEVCHKSRMSGHNVSHSKRRTNTRFEANVHIQSVFQDGKLLRVKICTRCLRSLHKSPRRAPVAVAGRPASR